jgi:predicted transcriptional regulator
MDRTIMDSLRSWKALSRQERPEEAGYHLYAVLQYAAELVRNHDRRELDEIRYRMEQTVAGEKPADAASYYLGLAQGMLDWLNVSAHVSMEEDMRASLSDLERELLQCIADNSRITPSQIRKAAHIDNKQHVSNLLSKLRAKGLVSYWQAGKNRWYKVTELGLKVLSELQTDKQHATTVSRWSLSEELKGARQWREALLPSLAATNLFQRPITNKASSRQTISIHFQYNDDIMAVYEPVSELTNGMYWHVSNDKLYATDSAETDERCNRKVLA